MGVAEQVRSVRAHEVEVAVAVRVPQMGAFTALEELRIVVGQQAHRLVAVHAAGDDGGGALAQLTVAAVGAVHDGPPLSLFIRHYRGRAARPPTPYKPRSCGSRSAWACSMRRSSSA